LPDEFSGAVFVAAVVINASGVVDLVDQSLNVEQNKASHSDVGIARHANLSGLGVREVAMGGEAVYAARRALRFSRDRRVKPGAVVFSGGSRRLVQMG
jgi:hypothetical protein